jgi:hypothetical protein
MPKKNMIIRLSGRINPEKEPDLAKATTELLKTYSLSNLSKEGIRCLARREGLLPPGTTDNREAAPA